MTGTVERMLPLYEAKMIHQYDHRWATYEPDGRFDGTISQVVSPTRVESREDLEPGTYFIAHQN